MKLKLGWDGWWPKTAVYEYTNSSLRKIYNLVCSFYHNGDCIGINFEDFKKQIVENGYISGKAHIQNAYIKGKWFWKKQVVEMIPYKWYVIKDMEEEYVNGNQQKSEKEIIIDKLVADYRKKLEDTLN